MIITSGSRADTNAVNQYNMQAWQQEQANKNALFGNLMNAAATIGAAALAPATGGASLAAVPAVASQGGK